MKYFFLFLLMPVSSFSQNKGASPIGNSQEPTANKNTYAVVVGISDYQDKDIPDLRFADKDAEAFANFLCSPAGGSLDGDHLKLLTNEQATSAQIGIALDWLMEVALEGDNVVIYFSGHGDVEAKRLSQPGYLLGWDAPSRVYMTGGTVNVRDLQDIVSTLSVTNKARVVVITDACHAGKLSGSEINGAQLTGQNLARQFANELKILSCQPNEYSIEGKQWGGGRGAFSYHLVDALYGLADGNGDLFITLQEVGRYLEDHVTAEVAPVSQVPIVIGNRADRLASVDAKLLADLRSGRTSQMAMLSPVEVRGMEDEVLAGVDTITRKLYRLFKNALSDKVFLEPAGACADFYYQKLMAEGGITRLHSTMTRNYAAVLQDDAQQTLNAWLKMRQRMPQKAFTSKVSTFLICLDRAAELLGREHYMYPVLKARRYFFEGFLLTESNLKSDRELGDKGLSLMRQSLSWQSEQPHVYWQMSEIFGWHLGQSDSMEHYARRAMEIQPNWELPCGSVAQILSQKYRQFDRARLYLEHASRINSNSSYVLNLWAVYYFNQGNFSESERQLLKAIRIDSTYVWAWANLGLCLSKTFRFAEAEPVFKNAILLDSTITWVWSEFGFTCLKNLRFTEAEVALKKAIALDSVFANPRKHLAMVCFKTNRPGEARQNFQKALELNPNYAPAMLGMAYLLTAEGKTAEAIGYVVQAIGKGAKFEQMQSDEDLAPLRATPGWKALMKKHFPDQIKD